MAAHIQRQGPQPSTLQPRYRIVNLWIPNGNGLSQTDLVMNGYLVTTKDLAEQCEILGVDYLYVNPALVAAMNVETPPPPPAPLIDPTLLDKTPGEEILKAAATDPPESDEE